MKRSLLQMLLLPVLLSGTLCVHAQDLVYEPINPAFGGNPYNYSWLMSSAQLQNTIEGESESDKFARDPLSDFEQSLNRQILSQLSRSLINSQFGEEGFTEGSYILGDYKIDISETGDGIQVIIFDESNGNQTTVQIPFF